MQRIRGAEVPPYEQWPIRDEQPPAFALLEAAWMKQADDTRMVLESVRDWQLAIEYSVTQDDGQREIVSTTAADIFTQLVLHEVHHRAQAMNMLRQLGVAVAELDFNAIMYQRRPDPA